MTVEIRGEVVEALALVADVLRGLEEGHPEARIDLYRPNSVSIRIRVIDPRFAGLGMPARHDRVWAHLEKLPDEVVGEISMVLLLAPGEVDRSISNFEFEHTAPSRVSQVPSPGQGFSSPTAHPVSLPSASATSNPARADRPSGV